MVAQAISAVALALLAASGLAKLLDPDPTRGAMAAARLPSSRWIARGLGALEIAAAVVGLVLAGVWLAPAATLYAGFFLFTLVAVQQRLPIQSCGCFGRDDTPPTVLHVAFNLVSAGALTYSAVMGLPAVPWDAPPLDVLVYLSFALLGAYLAYLLLAQLPRTLNMTTTTT
ncbi:MAG TPA: MauE/DoxX family redox-associated membrane protein [Acidimicrobiia bacterium]|nr:MauE/DoxX family redox-associated membrane protein [Acidimicrobiia bacterium]